MWVDYSVYDLFYISYHVTHTSVSGAMVILKGIEWRQTQQEPCCGGKTVMGKIFYGGLGFLRSYTSTIAYLNINLRFFFSRHAHLSVRES